MPLSVIQDHGVHASHCGYCGGDDTSVARGIVAETLSVDTYNDLLDRGWRRSGVYVYKPAHEQTCCQLLSIRLGAADFKPSKAQRKQLARWQRYLEGKEPGTAAQTRRERRRRRPATGLASAGERAAERPSTSAPPDAAGQLQAALDVATVAHLAALAPHAPAPPPARVAVPPPAQQRLSGATFTSAHALVLAAFLRRHGVAGAEAQATAAALAAMAPCPPGLAVTAESGHLNYRAEARAGVVRVEEGSGAKAQVGHHKESPASVTRHSFKSFLCSSPLMPRPCPGAGPGSSLEQGFGSYHHQYWLDGSLVAVSVIDILPRCISSKYFFWDPDLPNLSLGKVSSLLEIEWVRRAQRECASLQYYYLGFYLHTCHRMRYKGEYQPSDLLCPVSQCWVPFSRAYPALDQPGMPNLAALPGALDGLGASHLVQDGRPMAPPLRPTREELLGHQLICIRNMQGHTPKPREPVLLGQLVAAMKSMTPALSRLLTGLETWDEAAGPAWRDIAYLL